MDVWIQGDAPDHWLEHIISLLFSLACWKYVASSTAGHDNAKLQSLATLVWAWFRNLNEIIYTGYMKSMSCARNFTLNAFISAPQWAL